MKSFRLKFLVNLDPGGKPTHFESFNLDKIRLSYGHLSALAPCNTLGVLGLDVGRVLGVWCNDCCCILYIIHSLV